MADFDQHSFLPALDQPLEDPSSRATEELAPRRKRQRKYDAHITNYLAYYRGVATLHQVVDRFFVYDGIGGRYGYQVLRQMEADGIVTSHPLQPELGSISRRYVRLTPLGWSKSDRPWGIREGDITAVPKRFFYALQVCDMMIERQVEGWVLARTGEEYNRLRDAKVQELRRQVSPDQTHIRSLQRDQGPGLDRSVLWNTKTGKARLVLPSRPGDRIMTILESLDRDRLLPFSPFDYELVGHDPVKVKEDEKRVLHWAEKTHLYGSCFSSPSFLRRGHPAQIAPLAGSKYKTAGLLSPIALKPML